MKLFSSITMFSLFFLAGLFLVSCTSEETPSVSDRDWGLPFDVISVEGAAPIVQQAIFEDLDGNSVSISEFEGRVVLIDFWETWCGPCLKSFPTMQLLLDEYPDDFVVLAVTLGSVDSREDARAFADEHDYDFEFLYDANDLHKDLGVQAIPFKLFVNAGGNLVDIVPLSLGPQGDFEHGETTILEQRIGG